MQVFGQSACLPEEDQTVNKIIVFNNTLARTNLKRRSTSFLEAAQVEVPDPAQASEASRTRGHTSRRSRSFRATRTQKRLTALIPSSKCSSEGRVPQHQNSQHGLSPSATQCGASKQPEFFLQGHAAAPWDNDGQAAQLTKPQRLSCSHSAHDEDCAFRQSTHNSEQFSSKDRLAVSVT
eukprot:1994643-Amphidinium_carterae.1